MCVCVGAVLTSNSLCYRHLLVIKEAQREHDHPR